MSLSELSFPAIYSPLERKEQIVGNGVTYGLAFASGDFAPKMVAKLDSLYAIVRLHQDFSLFKYRGLKERN